jgi:hypothetical protein
LSAVDLLKEPADSEQKSALSVAKEFLLQELAEGPVAAEQVEKDARRAQVSARTLKRAKSALSVRSRKQGDAWYWVLPREKVDEDHYPTVGTLGTVDPLDKDAIDEPADSAYQREGGQGCQDGHGNRRPLCIHGFPDGAGCFLCDPEHPYRRRIEGSK